MIVVCYYSIIVDKTSHWYYDSVENHIPCIVTAFTWCKHALYIYIYIYMYIYIYIYNYTHICISTHVYIQIYVFSVHVFFFSTHALQKDRPSRGCYFFLPDHKRNMMHMKWLCMDICIYVICLYIDYDRSHTFLKMNIVL